MRSPPPAAEQGAAPNRLHVSKIIRSTDWTDKQGR
jgi:hypothetical protein